MRFYMHVGGWRTTSRSNALHLAPIRGRGFAAPSQRHRRHPIVLEVGAVALLRGQGRRSKHHSDADTCAVLPANKLSNSGADKARVDENMDGVDATTDISDTIVMHAERGEEVAAIQTQEYGSRAVRRRTPRGPAD